MWVAMLRQRSFSAGLEPSFMICLISTLFWTKCKYDPEHTFLSSRLTVVINFHKKMLNIYIQDSIQ